MLDEECEIIVQRFEGESSGLSEENVDGSNFIGVLLIESRVRIGSF